MAAPFGRLRTKRCAVAAAVGLVLGVVGASPALAAPPVPHLSIDTITLPSHFAPADAEDRYAILVTNTGAVSTEAGEPVVIQVTVPPSLRMKFFEGVDWETGEAVQCTKLSAESLRCTDLEAIPPDDTVEITLLVEALSATGTAHTEVSVSGAGAAPVSESTDTPFSAEPAPFAIEKYGFAGTGVDGAPEQRAAAHPYELTNGFELLSDENGNVEELYRAAKSPRELSFTLPEGFVGNPQVTPHCPLSLLQKTGFDSTGHLVAQCPPASRVGYVDLVSGRTFGPVGSNRRENPLTPIYNLTPEFGHPAEFGFAFLGYDVVTYADLVHTPSGYRLRVTVPGVPNINLDGSIVTFYGNPGARNESIEAHRPFLTNPSRCGGEPLSALFEVDSWEEPGLWQSALSPASPLSGCDQLQFHPTLSLLPDTTATASPAGLAVDLAVPQNEDPEGLATPPLRDATVTLPKGFAVNPSSADGLQGCSPAQIGLDSTQPGNCPGPSRIGDASLETPLLDHVIEGKVFLGTPSCAPCSGADAEAGKLINLYIEVSDPAIGVTVKLPGSGRLDPDTGQITASFKENPQFPFEDLKLYFQTGSRATLTTPPTCGEYTTTSDLEPWSGEPGEGEIDGTPDATPSSSFNLSTGPGGGSCAKSAAEEPNAPSFTAGSASPAAGAYSPFAIKLAREPGSQILKGLNVTLPPGLTGKLAGVAECPDAQIAAASQRSGAAEKASPSCPLGSEVGTVNVGAGSGAPYYVQGHAYLAGPYKGAPLSMAIVTPAVAGPFDLGTVVVRAALYVDPETARITVRSDPTPTILAGIPLDVRSIAVNVSRNQFTLNPTNCSPASVAATAIAASSQASLSSPFQVGGCRALGFKPKLALKLSGKTKRTGHPALTATVTYPSKGAYANIAAAQVTLPHSEFLDQAHIGTVCTRVQFAAGAGNGAGCPAASIYGHARAITPLLDQPIEGPVYLRSSNHNLPDLVAALGGQINVDLAGKVDTGKGGGIRNTFEVVPDAPVTKFVLSMQGGNRGLLVNSENICRKPQKALAHFVGQNGKVDNFNPTIANSCPKKSRKGHKHKGPGR